MSNCKRENKQKLINAAVQEYIDAYNNMKTISLGELSKKYGFKRSTISKYIKLAGGTVVNRTTGQNFNYEVFKNIDTEEKAYWLGVLYADGCCTTNYSVELTVHKDDIDILKKYCKFLEIKEDRIKYYKNIVRVRVCHKYLWQSLVEKGCVRRKSLILKFPDETIFQKSELIRHFMRGYCDGDGCLRYYTNKKGATICDLEVVGTREFLLKFQTILDIRGGILRNASCTSNHTKIYKLSYRCMPARAVARVLYTNNHICLERKFNVFKSFCRFEEESSNVKSSKIGEGCDANPEVISWITKGQDKP